MSVDLSNLWSLILEEIKMTMNTHRVWLISGVINQTIASLKDFRKNLPHLASIRFYYFEDFSPQSSSGKSFLTIVPLQIQLHSVMIDDFVHS